MSTEQGGGAAPAPQDPSPLAVAGAPPPTAKPAMEPKVEDKVATDNGTPAEETKANGGTAASEPMEIDDKPKPEGDTPAAAEDAAAADDPEKEVFDSDLKSLSISAGNSHIQWAFHAAPKEHYSPLLFWRTPHLPDSNGGPDKDPEVAKEYEEVIKDPAKATDTLTRHLPETVQSYIFGEDDADVNPADSTDDNPIAGPNKIHIYIVSTSPCQLEALQKVWDLAECQCSVEVMDNNSFFDTEVNKGVYSTMGSDRLSALKGAISLYGLPAMVVDGGTAMTYTAADPTGRIMGGGISPGLRLRLGVLHSCTGALPFISPEEAFYRVMGRISGKEDDPANQDVLKKAQDIPALPMNLFSATTEEAMVVSCFGEVGTWLRRAIGGWLRIVGSSKKKGGRGRKKTDSSSLETLISGKKVNSDRNIVFTGGDAEVLMTLTTKFGDVIQVGSSNKKVVIVGDTKVQDNLEAADVGVLNNCQVVSRNNLVHYGVAAVLAERYSNYLKKTGKRGTSEVDIDNLNGLIGQRVAKKFDALNTDGSNFFRGVVNEIYPDEQGDPLFGITYDDGDREHMNLGELREAMQLFLEVGDLGQHPSTKAPTPKKPRGRPMSKEPVAKKPKKEKKPATPVATSATKSPARKKELPPPMSELCPTDPKGCVGLRVAKYFETDLFFGSVDAANPDPEAEAGFFYHIVYDDGDMEDLDRSEFEDSRKLYFKKKKKDPNPSYRPPETSPPKARAPEQAPKPVSAPAPTAQPEPSTKSVDGGSENAAE